MHLDHVPSNTDHRADLPAAGLPCPDVTGIDVGSSYEVVKLRGVCQTFLDITNSPTVLRSFAAFMATGGVSVLPTTVTVAPASNVGLIPVAEQEWAPYATKPVADQLGTLCSRARADRSVNARYLREDNCLYDFVSNHPDIKALCASCKDNDQRVFRIWWNLDQVICGQLQVRSGLDIYRQKEREQNAKCAERLIAAFDKASVGEKTP